MKKIICITGASSGFGEACAFKFSANHYNLIITGRREERLKTLKKTLEEKFGNQVYVLPSMCRTGSQWRMLSNLT